MAELPPPMPPPPPPRPVAPLDYSNANYYATSQPSDPKPSFHQQAARASWMAPLIAMVLGYFSNVANTNSTNSSGNIYFSGTMIIGLVNCGLIIFGLLCGIFALTGVRKQGPKKILAPAIVGISINGILIVSAIFLIAIALRARGGVPGSVASVANRPALSQQQLQDSLGKYPGWTGMGTANSAVIVLTSVSSQTPLGQDVKIDLPTNFLLVVLTVDAHQCAEMTRIDTADVKVYLRDGSSRSGLRPQDVYLSAGSNAAQMLAVYPPIWNLPSHQAGLASRWIFLPADIDPLTIDHVAIRVSGNMVNIPGKFLSVEEKTANMRRAQEAPAAP